MLGLRSDRSSVGMSCADGSTEMDKACTNLFASLACEFCLCPFPYCYVALLNAKVNPPSAPTPLSKLPNPDLLSQSVRGKLSTTLSFSRRLVFVNMSKRIRQERKPVRQRPPGSDMIDGPPSTEPLLSGRHSLSRGSARFPRPDLLHDSTRQSDLS